MKVKHSPKAVIDVSETEPCTWDSRICGAAVTDASETEPCP